MHYNYNDELNYDVELEKNEIKIFHQISVYYL